MIPIKTKEEIGRMAKGGRILAKVLAEVANHVKPDVSELELDKLAEDLILKKGAEPGFKKVKGYNHTLCVSTNDIVVHGVPGDYRFQEGEVVGIDCGVYYQGFYTDMAETILVGAEVAHENFRVRDAKKVGSLSLSAKSASSHSKNFAGSPRQDYDSLNRFLQTGKRALEEAIRAAKIENRVGHISKIIQEIVEEAGYSVVRSLVGHGIGRNLHEEPEVPGFIVSPIEKTPLLKEGMTIAIEVIYNLGKPEVVFGQDKWTIKTKDGSLSSVFEKTIAIAKNGPVVLTK